MKLSVILRKLKKVQSSRSFEVGGVRSESMEKQEYIEEVNLIKEQNDTEFEIYPMAVEIIQPTIKNLSKRYVFARRKTDKGQIYYGISSFPDVAILDKNL